MSGMTPDVSVILPVHNGVQTVAESIDSILSQELVLFELIVVDDASTDASRAVLSAFDDPRIVRLELDANQGLAEALNRGIAASRAPLIARQDQDDIAHPQRLRRQLEYFATQEDLVLLGTWATIVAPDELGSWTKVGEHRHPQQDDELRVRLLWNNPFVHSSVVFARDAFDAVGGYRRDPTQNFPEDYDLWTRMAKVGRLGNVPEQLLTYRMTIDGMSRTGSERLRSGVVLIAVRNMADLAAVPLHDPCVNDAVCALNNVRVGRRSLLTIICSVSRFWRASFMARSGGRRLLFMRVRAVVKIVARSFKSS